MLRTLQLRDFRCFRGGRLELGEGNNCLIGPNGAGKTSLLEAVSVLVRLQSPRTRLMANLVRRGAASFSLEGDWGGGYRLAFRFGERERRWVLDGVEQRRTDLYLGVGRVVYFGNPDMELVRGGAEVRRRFLDALGVQAAAGYAGLLRAYERSLRARNLLLKRGGDGRQLRAYEGGLVRAGTALATHRSELIGALAPRVARACEALGGERLEMAYRRGWEGDFAEALGAAREMDLRLGHTTVGPHRDEIGLALGDLDVGEFASEGQQRGVVLALRIAEGELLGAVWGSAPIYLVDDIFGELDRDRRNRFFAALPAGAQRILTSTDLSWLEPGIGARRFRVVAGEVTPAG